jgi:hypothetical protein
MVSLTFVFVSLLYKTDRFHVAVRLFSNRSRRRQNKVRTSVTHSAIASCATFWRHLINFWTDARHWHGIYLLNRNRWSQYARILNRCYKIHLDFVSENIHRDPLRLRRIIVTYCSSHNFPLLSLAKTDHVVRSCAATTVPAQRNSSRNAASSYNVFDEDKMDSASHVNFS